MSIAPTFGQRLDRSWGKCSNEHVEAPPHALVQITLNTAAVRVTTRAQAKDAYVAKCIENTRGGGGWSFVDEAGFYVAVRPTAGFARIELGDQRGGLDRYAVAVVAWDDDAAAEAWNGAVAEAAAFGSLPKLTMPKQLPWLAAHVRPAGIAKGKAFIARLGEVARAGAWAVMGSAK